MGQRGFNITLLEFTDFKFSFSGFNLTRSYSDAVVKPGPWTSVGIQFPPRKPDSLAKWRSKFLPYKVQ